MEHHLGLTRDPSAASSRCPASSARDRRDQGHQRAPQGPARRRLPLRPLGKVVKTMRDTGADMKDKYKETARGGLAVNVVEC
jgi:L-serine dehydratase